jgi:hypothetical protein
LTHRPAFWLIGPVVRLLLRGHAFTLFWLYGWLSVMAMLILNLCLSLARGWTLMAAVLHQDDDEALIRRFFLHGKRRVSNFFRFYSDVLVVAQSVFGLAIP